MLLSSFFSSNNFIALFRAKTLEEYVLELIPNVYISNINLAEYIDITTETISRLLISLKNEGLIIIKDKQTMNSLFAYL